MPSAVSEREPPVPPPHLSLAVSPWTIRIFSNGTPRRSLTTWAKAVSWPWPFDWVPTATLTVPSSSKLIDAVSCGSPMVDLM